jgi:hypothetical protein
MLGVGLVCRSLVARRSVEILEEHRAPVFEPVLVSAVSGAVSGAGLGMGTVSIEEFYE